MKWAAILVCLALLLPASEWLRRNSVPRLWAWTLVGFLPFFVSALHLYMAVISWAYWGGYVKGAEISIIDLIALVLYRTLPSDGRPLPLRLAMVAYFVAILLSALQAAYPEAALFYAWQIARMFLVYAVVARGCADKDVTWALLKGMAAGIVVQACLALWERFILGSTQTGGTVGHQNLLGLMSHLVILPFFALLLAGRRGLLPPLVLIAGIVIDVSTASRGTIGLVSFGLATLFALSAVTKWTSRKARVLVICLAAVGPLAPVVVWSFQERFNKVALNEEEYDEREAYKTAAAAMLSDNPLGVGANHYSVAGNLSGYFDRGGVQSYAIARAGNVHNIYYLAGAEAGYPAIITLLFLLICPLFVAFRCGLRHLDDDRGHLLLGLGVALLTVYLHSWVEWSLATFSAEYLLVIAIGMVAGNAMELGYWRYAQFQYRRVPSFARNGGHEKELDLARRQLTNGISQS